ncbi:hypothetical protein EBT31_13820 [bacterium]|jgi:hypothetical protein|nr:hypothetical protein [bacterium]
MTLKLLPPLYEWQRWSDDYEPTFAELGAMTDEEYDNYTEAVLKPRLAKSKRNHPTHKENK